jgi:chromosome segregation ATPase
VEVLEGELEVAGKAKEGEVAMALEAAAEAIRAVEHERDAMKGVAQAAEVDRQKAEAAAESTKQELEEARQGTASLMAGTQTMEAAAVATQAAHTQKVEGLRAEVAEGGRRLVEECARTKELASTDAKLRERLEQLSTEAGKEAVVAANLRREAKAASSELEELRPRAQLLANSLTKVEAQLVQAKMGADARQGAEAELHGQVSLRVGTVKYTQPLAVVSSESASTYLDLQRSWRLHAGRGAASPA